MAPPKAWSDKDERKYEHIKKSAKKRGKSTRRAKEIAAATVNRDRSEEGRTKSQKKSSGSKSKRSSSSSSSNRGRLENRTVDQLKKRARALDIEGRSSMNKSELVSAIREANG